MKYTSDYHASESDKIHDFFGGSRIILVFEVIGAP
jgi:hypothetical protein